jgi:hypothetical protein
MSAFVELFAATAMFLAIGRDTEEALRKDIGPVPVCNAQCERRMGAIRPMEWTMPLVGDVVRARQKRREDVKRFAANQQKGWPRPRSSCVKKFITQETKDATPKPGRPEGGFPGKLTRNPRGGRFFATCDETGLYDSAARWCAGRIDGLPERRGRVKFGRPRKLTPHQRQEALQRLDGGDTGRRGAHVQRRCNHDREAGLTVVASQVRTLCRAEIV